MNVLKSHKNIKIKNKFIILLQLHHKIQSCNLTNTLLYLKHPVMTHKIQIH